MIGKHVVIDTLDNFKAKLDQIPSSAIVLIKDVGQIYAHGTYFGAQKTYSLLTKTADGLAPKGGTSASSQISDVNTEWVLTVTNGENPTWRKLPANAFSSSSYTLPSATISDLGGIKVGQVYTATFDDLVGQYYKINIDKNGLAYVHVPWINNPYTASGSGITLKDNVFSLSLNSVTKLDSAIGNKIYAVSLDKNGKLCVSVPWTDTNNIFVGATETKNGSSGMVPAPIANQHSYFLRGDGTWVKPNLSDLNDDVVNGKYLPLSGGTISNSDYGALDILRKSNDGLSGIAFSNWSGINGYLGIGGSASTFPKQPTFIDSSYIAYQIWHSGTFNPSDYLPKSGGVLSGDISFGADNKTQNNTGTNTRLPSHIYRNVYDTSGNVYDHYFNPKYTASKNTFANLRVATNGGMKVLRFGGDGTFTWDGNTVIHSGNYSSYALPLSGGTIDGNVVINGTSTGPLNVNTTSTVEVGIPLKMSSVTKGWLGYNSTAGTYLYNNASKHYLGIKDDGSIYYNKGTILYSGNYSSYALPLTGGTLDGSLTIRAASATSDSWIEFSNKSDSVVHKLGIRRPESSYGLQYYNGSEYYKIWHAGNGGSGSGLDADLLDGKHATDFMQYSTGGKYVQANLINSELWSLAGGNGYIEYYDSGTWFNSKWGKVTAHYGFEGSLSGNASSATKLQTPRTIWGKSFDGTSNVNGVLTLGTSYITGNDGADILNSEGQWCYLGAGTSEKGFPTYIDGHTIRIRYGTSHTEGVRISSSGNVGIGTTNPSYKLDVNGSLKINEFIDIREPNTKNRFTAYVYSGIGRLYSYNDDTGYNDLYVGQNSTSAIVVKANGSIGIGTGNPAYKFDVSGDIHNTTNIFSNGAFLAASGSEGAYLHGTGISWHNSSNIWVKDLFTYSDSADTLTLHRNTSCIGTATFNNQIISKVADGTAPLTVISTTKVTNLNADKLDDHNASEFPLLNGIKSGTWNWNDVTRAGYYKIQAGTITNHPSNIYQFGMAAVLTTENHADEENRELQLYYPHNQTNNIAIWGRMHNASTQGNGWGPWWGIPNTEGVKQIIGTYYWANIKISATSNDKTTPTFGNVTINHVPTNYQTPSLNINYNSSFQADEYSISLLKFGNTGMDNYLGVAPAEKTVFGTDAYFFHTSDKNEFNWQSSSWKKLMGLKCSDGTLYVKGNVGVSTVSPSYNLSVGSSICANFNANGSRVLLEPAAGGVTGGGIAFWGSSGWHNGTINASVLVLNNASGGYVGIGQTSPKAKLDVNGEIYTNPYIRFVDSQRYCGYFSSGKYLELHNGIGEVGIHLYDDGNAYVYKSGSKYTIMHSGNYSSYALPFYLKTTASCNSYTEGLTVVSATDSNAAHTNHSAFLTVTNLGTPFQIQIPDSSINYIYKRYKSGSSWSAWSKLSAGYADSAGNADTIDNYHISVGTSAGTNSSTIYFVT